MKRYILKLDEMELHLLKEGLKKYIDYRRKTATPSTLGSGRAGLPLGAPHYGA